MIDFGGVVYVIDLEAYSKAIKLGNSKPSDLVVTKTVTTSTTADGETITNVTEVFNERGFEIDGSKYDTIRMLLEIVMDEVDDETDDTLGVDRALDKSPLSYKIAFNTLISYGILKELETE